MGIRYKVYTRCDYCTKLQLDDCEYAWQAGHPMIKPVLPWGWSRIDNKIVCADHTIMVDDSELI